MTRFAFVLVFAAACTGSPTGATCPPADPPTYDNFGRQFFATYCSGCHSRDTRNRNGAPASQNYDSEDDIAVHTSEIDAEAASGPDATNTSMPELGGGVARKPTVEERARLGEYLACLEAK